MAQPNDKTYEAATFVFWNLFSYFPTYILHSKLFSCLVTRLLPYLQTCSILVLTQLATLYLYTFQFFRHLQGTHIISLRIKFSVLSFRCLILCTNFSTPLRWDFLILSYNCLLLVPISIFPSIVQNHFLNSCLTISTPECKIILCLVSVLGWLQDHPRLHKAGIGIFTPTRNKLIKNSYIITVVSNYVFFAFCRFRAWMSWYFLTYFAIGR